MVLKKKSGAFALPFSSSSNDENLFLSPFDSIDYYYPDPFNWQGDLFFMQDFPIDDLPFLGDLFPQDSVFSTLGNELEEHSAQVQEMKCEPMDFISEIDEEERVKIKSLEMCNVDESSPDDTKKSVALLGKEDISQYFYMPITRAARELNVGLTLLKKRCRELGIRRWPHRKLMSLQTLINNVEGMKKEGRMNEAELREAIAKLENEKNLLEGMPNVLLQDNTKRLRQACFKANYNKRKIIRKVLK